MQDTAQRSKPTTCGMKNEGDVRVLSLEEWTEEWARCLEAPLDVC